MSKTLYLPLKKKWYDMIESGEKTEEYRAMSPYWVKRLTEGIMPKHFDYVRFSYGYTKRTMTFRFEEITWGYGKEEWGYVPSKMVFMIKLGDRIK